MVHIGVVKSDEMRPLLPRKLKPSQDLFHALFVRKFVIKMKVVAGTFPLYFRRRARPEETGGAHSLLFRERPERRAAIPATVTACFCVRVRIFLFALRI